MRSVIPQSLLALSALGLVAADPHFSPNQRYQFAHGGKFFAQSNLVSTAWYAEWHSQQFPLDSVPWSKYTHLNYAFKYVVFSSSLYDLADHSQRLSTEDPSDISLPEADAKLLPQFVAKAHENVSLSFICAVHLT